MGIAVETGQQPKMGSGLAQRWGSTPKWASGYHRDRGSTPKWGQDYHGDSTSATDAFEGQKYHPLSQRGQPRGLGLPGSPLPPMGCVLRGNSPSRALQPPAHSGFPVPPGRSQRRHGDTHPPAWWHTRATRTSRAVWGWHHHTHQCHSQKSWCCWIGLGLSTFPLRSCPAAMGHHHRLPVLVPILIPLLLTISSPP